ncbi:hypothetical protein MTR67_013444 [Solanum verrucosum]|uniref:Uncharacterized protein n=1 Tax=Solanum verrucosum TaxID=315347 RepID=A0AAF0QHM0_SOLVR|nr:hypothetical protein MTR67_013444 [Solanum verrucosum]
MRDYGHELLNSRTSWYNLKRVRNSILNTQDLELEDITPLKDTQFMNFMQNSWELATRIEGLNNNMELMYTTLLILILAFTKLSSNRWLNSKDSQLNSKAFMNSTLNSLLNVNYEFKSYGS